MAFFLMSHISYDITLKILTVTSQLKIEFRLKGVKTGNILEHKQYLCLKGFCFIKRIISEDMAMEYNK